MWDAAYHNTYCGLGAYCSITAIGQKCSVAMPGSPGRVCRSVGDSVHVIVPWVMYTRAGNEADVEGMEHDSGVDLVSSPLMSVVDGWVKHVHIQLSNTGTAIKSPGAPNLTSVG
jgi:hypothetical protein